MKKDVQRAPRWEAQRETQREAHEEARSEARSQAHGEARKGAREFSRVVADEAMTGGERIEEISAGPGECRALAARFGLVAIRHLTARIRLSRLEGGRMVRLRGTLSADVVQSCVVTLEPVPALITEEFGALFAPASAIPEDPGCLVLDPLALDEDLPEPMEPGGIDIGELAAQHLSLALDPYPRRPGASFAGFDDEAITPEAVTNPFKVLAGLKSPS